jgi:hypothetical protein
MVFNDRGNSSRGRDRNHGGFGGPKEMHNATCSDCGVETQVPFKPILTDLSIAESVSPITGNPERKGTKLRGNHT